MKLELEKVRSEKYYRIGYIPAIDKYVIATVITWIAWYDRFYEITEDEYNLYEIDIYRLDQLAERFYKMGCNGERFLFSEKIEENNRKQKKVLNKCLFYNIIRNIMVPINRL